MTTLLEKKIGQLLVIGFDGTTVPRDVKQFIQDYHVGGIILFARNIESPEQVLRLTTDLQRTAKKAGHAQPLLICVDQENGVVRRLEKGTTLLPGAMAIGATQKESYSYDIGLATAKELKALGMNWNLAPVLDVNNNPDNPVIGVRSFGEEADKVASFGREAMKGMQEGGMITTLKHFPGHGDTNVDSHLGLPTIPHSMERLNEVELKPFRACIQEGADTVMTAHIHFPALEKEEGVPATLSKTIVTGLLREELGFDGVVTTDCMEMDAIGKTVGTEKGGLAAVKAGVDIVMISHTLDKQKGALEAIKGAVVNGDLDEALIDQACARVSKLKDTYATWENTSVTDGPIATVVGCEEHERLAEEVYKQSVTVVKNEGALPLKTDQVVVLEPVNQKTMQVEDEKYAHLALGEAVKSVCEGAKTYTLPKTVEELDAIMNDTSTFIVGTLSAGPNSEEVTLIKYLVQKNKTVIVVAMRSPYDLAHLPPGVGAYMATYEFSYPALKIAAKAIFGKEDVKGKAPVTL
ncbi:beta-N-acetylhexosaminidase [Alteribacter aurantiacus]|uniref:beta-N-acetylhexosaminidase n=1 Tax=Alteribacter aurantiacus TaxID=254410 RepID=UPI000422734C|nr:beta-N-acetylhexosaminidase [Alteribacter aurantiacus]